MVYTPRRYRGIKGGQVELLLSKCFEDLYSNLGIKIPGTDVAPRKAEGTGDHFSTGSDRYYLS